MSSDALRGVVGSGEHVLDASADGFAILEQVVAARLGRRLCTGVDTLGLDPVRRTGWLALARATGLERYEKLAGEGVETVFLALADLEGADDLQRLAPRLA